MTGDEMQTQKVFQDFLKASINEAFDYMKILNDNKENLSPQDYETIKKGFEDHIIECNTTLYNIGM